MNDKYFIGTYNNIYLGFRIDQIEKIIKGEKIIQIPGLNKYYSGIIYTKDENKKENIIPIINTIRYLGIKNKKKELEEQLKNLDKNIQYHLNLKNNLENEISYNNTILITKNKKNQKIGIMIDKTESLEIIENIYPINTNSKSIITHLGKANKNSKTLINIIDTKKL